MIVNKPQFDVESIQPGQAYWLTENRGYRNNINTPCIITNVKPLTIVVSYYSDKDKRMTEQAFDINSIVNKNFELKPMIAQKFVEVKMEDIKDAN